LNVGTRFVLNCISVCLLTGCSRLVTAGGDEVPRIRSEVECTSELASSLRKSIIEYLPKKQQDLVKFNGRETCHDLKIYHDAIGIVYRFFVVRARPEVYADKSWRYLGLVSANGERSINDLNSEIPKTDAARQAPSAQQPYLSHLSMLGLSDWSVEPDNTIRLVALYGNLTTGEVQYKETYTFLKRSDSQWLFEKIEVNK
jgi:hypothetical protein